MQGWLFLVNQWYLECSCLPFAFCSTASVHLNITAVPCGWAGTLPEPVCHVCCPAQKDAFLPGDNSYFSCHT